MQEFIHNYEDHLHQAFYKFKKTYNKNYKDDLDHMYRKDLFRQHIRYIFVSSIISIVCIVIPKIIASYE